MVVEGKSDTQGHKGGKRGAEAHVELAHNLSTLTVDDLDDLDDAPDEEVEILEEQVVDQSSSTRTIRELETELASLLTWKLSSCTRHALMRFHARDHVFRDPLTSLA